MNKCTIEKQKGAILIIVGVTLAVLLGFAGLVIDLGGLFVTKSELQSALDSCALAAAQELNGAAGATADNSGPGGQSRATNAGLTAGNANKSQYQASSVNLVESDVTFSDTLNGAFSRNFPSATAKYARCTHQINGIAAYFIQLVGGSSSNSVGALAKATLSPSQTTCSLPLGLLPKPGGTSANNYGYQIGEWVKMVYGTSPSPGEMGWFNLDGSTNANETEDEIKFGYCKTSIGKQVGTPGVQASVDDAWNARFGIYKNAGSPATAGFKPDLTGYAYTSKNWTNPAPQSAFDGTPAAGSDPTAANFSIKRSTPNFANYANTGTSVNGGDTITGLTMPGGFRKLATAGIGGEHQTLGGDRRLVSLPVINQSGSTYTVTDYVCMLMLQPLTCNNNGAGTSCASVQLEYRGLASLINSPCAANGLGGGTAGPLVPVLVE